MTCTKHNIPDNNQDGLDIKSCLKCEGKGFTKHDLFGARGEVEHLLEFSKANKSKLMVGKICEPCNGTGLGEKVKKIWYEDCWKCDGTGEVYWGVCWACGGRKKRAFKTSPEVRAKRRETARKKREEKAVLRLEKELARQREITGGLTFAEKREEREAQWAEEKAKAQDVPTGTVNISGEVLKVALQETRFGQVAKMTVKDHQNGFVVWGSVPTIFDEEGKLLTVGKGDHITFTASVTPSEKDAKFGFFKRPRKAVISQVSV
tara:strand:- start:5738 stop:6523 length:786 start_codon:yes stop_codon:yes gene_type:complete